MRKLEAATSTSEDARIPAGIAKCREAEDDERCWLETDAVDDHAHALAVASDVTTGISL